MIYQVPSSTVPIERWFETREEPIAAFERKCKRLGIAPLEYPPSCCKDIFTDDRIAYPHRQRAAGIRDGHGLTVIKLRAAQCLQTCGTH